MYTVSETISSNPLMVRERVWLHSSESVRTLKGTRGAHSLRLSAGAEPSIGGGGVWMMLEVRGEGEERGASGR